MKAMLFQQRMAYQRMGRWQPAHRVLWGLRVALPCNRLTNALWRAYIRTWPS